MIWNASAKLSIQIYFLNLELFLSDFFLSNLWAKNYLEGKIKS